MTSPGAPSGAVHRWRRSAGSPTFGDDRYFSVDNARDGVFENVGEGTDVATIDAADHLFGDIEQTTVESPVGRMKLTPSAVRTRSGERVRVKLGWSYPKAWRQVRSLKLRARAVDGKVVGTVAVDPAHGRASGHSAVNVLPTSKVRHHRKTVTADLIVHTSRKLAGRSFQLEVQATDIHGHTQHEPLAGTLRVTK
jgi:hypothetical protein